MVTVTLKRDLIQGAYAEVGSLSMCLADVPSLLSVAPLSPDDILVSLYVNVQQLQNVSQKIMDASSGSFVRGLTGPRAPLESFPPPWFPPKPAPVPKFGNLDTRHFMTGCHRVHLVKTETAYYTVSLIEKRGKYPQDEYDFAVDQLTGAQQPFPSEKLNELELGFQELKARLEAIEGQDSTPGIGHNYPPADLNEQSLRSAQVGDAIAAINIYRTEISTDTPDPIKLDRALTALRLVCKFGIATIEALNAVHAFLEWFSPALLNDFMLHVEQFKALFH